MRQSVLRVICALCLARVHGSWGLRQAELPVAPGTSQRHAAPVQVLQRLLTATLQPQRDAARLSGRSLEASSGSGEAVSGEIGSGAAEPGSGSVAEHGSADADGSSEPSSGFDSASGDSLSTSPSPPPPSPSPPAPPAGPVGAYLTVRFSVSKTSSGRRLTTGDTWTADELSELATAVASVLNVQLTSVNTYPNPATPEFANVDVEASSVAVQQSLIATVNGAAFAGQLSAELPGLTVQVESAAVAVYLYRSPPQSPPPSPPSLPAPPLMPPPPPLSPPGLPGNATTDGSGDGTDWRLVLAIVGGTVGGVLVLCTCFTMALVIHRRKQRAKALKNVQTSATSESALSSAPSGHNPRGRRGRKKQTTVLPAPMSADGAADAARSRMPAPDESSYPSVPQIIAAAPPAAAEAGAYEAAPPPSMGYTPGGVTYEREPAAQPYPPAEYAQPTPPADYPPQVPTATVAVPPAEPPQGYGYEQPAAPVVSTSTATYEQEAPAYRAPPARPPGGGQGLEPLAAGPPGGGRGALPPLGGGGRGALPPLGAPQ